jgi:hypothetical protein
MDPAQPRPPWQPPPGFRSYPDVVSPDAPLRAAASLRVLSAGGLGERVTSTVALVRDGAAVIVVNPGVVVGAGSILRPLADLGIAPAAITDVVALRAAAGHLVSAALFPGARLHRAVTVSRNHGTSRRRSGGFAVSPSVRLIESPGLCPGDLTALVATLRGIVAITHLWSSGCDGAPAPDRERAALGQARLRVLGVASRIIPAHGPAFRASPDTPV